MKLVKSGCTLLKWWHPKAKKKLKVDCDYTGSMRLNFNNEKFINSLPFWLERQMNI